MYQKFIKAKNDFLEAAKRTFDSGIQTGTGGNLSVRIPDTDLMIVKPSGFSYGQCSEENLVVTDFDGNVISGDYKPSQECLLHGSLYKTYPSIGAIVHTHSPYAILNSLKYDEIELPTLHAELKLQKSIPVVNVETQAVTKDELSKVFDAFNKNPNLKAFVLKRHGIVAVGPSAVKAGLLAELIEETSIINWKLKNN